MSEQAYLARACLRWALALALATGTVAGSVLPALGQDGTEAPAEQPADAEASANAAFEAAVAGYVAEEIGAEIAPAAEAPAEEAPAAVDEAPAAVEEAPPAEAAPADQAPVEQAPAEEQVAQDAQTEQAPPVEEPAAVETPYYDPVVAPVSTTNGNPIFDNPAAQEALAGSVTDPVALPVVAVEPAPPAEEPAPAADESVAYETESAESGNGETTAQEATETAVSADPLSGNIFSNCDLNPECAVYGGVPETTPADDTATTADTVETTQSDGTQPATQDMSTASSTQVDETEAAPAENADDGSGTADASGTESEVNLPNPDVNGDGRVSVVEQQKARKQEQKRTARKDNNNDGKNGSNNRNNGGGNNGSVKSALKKGNNNGGGNNGGRNNNRKGKNNRHRMGLAASFVASYSGRGGDTASAGNGGRANASADGGIVVIGAINSGGNSGNTIAVGDIGGGYGACGPTSIDGGTVNNTTNLNIDAGGGTAIGDVSGGSNNVAIGDGSYMVSTGNGGVAGTTANGGIVVIEEVNSGGNAGNSIGVGDIYGCGGGSGAPVSINGGNVDNTTNINIDASGGTAIADASGGSDNLAAASGDGKDNDRNNGRRGRRGGLRQLIKSRYGFGRNIRGGDTASAGNGGRANASADGGIVVIKEINSGNNRGNTISVGNIGGGGGGGSCVDGPVVIDGGNVQNITNLNIDASGGTSISDASGGSGNMALTSGDDGGIRAPIRSRYGLGPGNGGGGAGTASAGNGGLATSTADGGIVVIDEINSGGNQGNTIEVGDICTGPVYVPDAPAKPGKPGKPGRPEKAPAPTTRRGGGKVRVTRIPSTGVGHIPAPAAPVNTMPAAVLPVRWDEDDLEFALEDDALV